MNFPKFSESKGILKIGQSEVCVQGGGAEGRTFKSRLRVYIYTGSLDLRVRPSAPPPECILLIVQFSKFLLI